MRSLCTSRGPMRRSGRSPPIWGSVRRHCGTGCGLPEQAVHGDAGRRNRPSRRHRWRQRTRLRKKVRELEEEREILRRTARYFAGETRW